MSEPVTRYVVGPREAGKRLDQYLHEKIPGLSRTRIQRAIRDRVTLSWGVRARPSTPVRRGGEVRIGFTPIVEEPLDLQIPVITRAPGWLAVDKPPHIPVHPVNRVRENSLIRLLRRQEGEEELRLAHRLDAETSGVLLVARDVPTSSFLSQAFMNGKVDKEYVAVVRGVVEGDEGRIDRPIGPAESSRVFVRLAVAPGRASVTDWKVSARGEGCTILRLYPRSGRRHQLRVHLEGLGHPILGDPLYGRPDEDYLRMVRGEGDPRRDSGGPQRLLLHCSRLAFPDPHGAGSVEVRAPTPPELSLGGISGETT